jgi:hypothetical protein
MSVGLSLSTYSLWLCGSAQKHCGLVTFRLCNTPFGIAAVVFHFKTIPYSIWSFLPAEERSMSCELLILYCEERSYFALLTLTVMFFSRKPRHHEDQKVREKPRNTHCMLRADLLVGTIYLFLFRCEIPN